ncbi:V-ATPase proteolipid subunit C-like domain-containing protein [Mrakia frigida]|uniref:V-type proton ATPase proteolipid subunit n=1 Tax=Mrakia frigida TaxID=29902 RepID=UPI003FCC0793
MSFTTPAHQFAPHCPVYSPFFGALGAAAAIIFCAIGAAFGTAKASVGIASAGVLRPDLLIKSCLSVVMAGIISIYGLIIAVMIANSLEAEMSLFRSFTYLAAGLAVGLSGLAAGLAVGVVGDVGARATAQQPKIFVGMVLILIFAEVLGLYGLIVGLILLTNGNANDLACSAA